MSISAGSSARLLFRVDPLPRESPRGYLCRVAHEHGYGGPLSLAQIAGLSACDLEREERVKQISHVLRLEPDEWRAMCYRHIKGRDRFDQRSFCGKRVSADDLNYGRPRLCPACLRERPIWWAVWDLGLGHRVPHPPLSSPQSVPGLQKETGLAASGRTQMPLRPRLSQSRSRGGGQRSGGDQCSNLSGSRVSSR